MRTPSIKTLRAIFGDDAPAAKRLLTASRETLLENETAKALEKSCYYAPSLARLRLATLDALGNFHGVESLESQRGEFAVYLNAGDCYAATLIRWRLNYRVQSIGDFIETMARQGVNVL